MEVSVFRTSKRKRETGYNFVR